MTSPAHFTQRWRVGDLTITAVVESEMAGLPPSALLPDATEEAVQAQSWACGDYTDPSGAITIAIQAFIIDDGQRRVLVDPCVGNFKNRWMPFWNQQEYDFLERLIAAGYPPDAIDLVVHTHLHADHVGWDTTLVDGRWVPTFANARHLYIQEELDFWQAPEHRENDDVFADSIEPVFDAKLADIVTDTDDIGGGLVLTPSRGHTPGHASLLISSAGEHAVITGDFIHHPVQCSEPDWAEIGDWNPEMARTTRHEALARYAADGRLVFGTHFPTQPTGHIVPHESAWRFSAVAGTPCS